MKHFQVLGKVQKCERDVPDIIDKIRYRSNILFVFLILTDDKRILMGLVSIMYTHILASFFSFIT